MNKIEEYRKLISEGYCDIALKKILAICYNYDEKFKSDELFQKLFTQIIVLLSRYNSNKTFQLLNTEEPDLIKIEFNKINFAFLNIINELPIYSEFYQFLISNIAETEIKQETNLLKSKTIHSEFIQHNNEENLWAKCILSNSIINFQEYIYKFPFGKHINVAKELQLKLIKNIEQQTLDENIQNWWLNLPINWKNYFQDKFSINTNFQQIFSLSDLDISRTEIENLEPIRNFVSLIKVDLSNTIISSLLPIINCLNLEYLNFCNTRIFDLSPLQNINKIKWLMLSNTPIKSIDCLQYLNKLEIIDCSNTSIKTLKSLANIKTLQELQISNTNIDSLVPVMELPNLRRIWCLNTKIDSNMIERFANKMPKCKIN